MVPSTCHFILIKLLTLVAISKEESKVTAVFVLVMLFYSSFALFLMYNYWSKSNEWRNKEHSHDMKFLDQDISLHTVLVKGLDKTIPVDRMSDILTQTFTKLLPGPKVI